jgi:hypothetical protein
MMFGFQRSRVAIYVALSAAMLGGSVMSASAQTVPSNLPAAILCYAKADQSWRVGYLNRVNKNGEALYAGAGGALSATVDAKGIVLAPNNRPAGLDCFGKSLEELRIGGRLMDFQPKR